MTNPTHSVRQWATRHCRLLILSLAILVTAMLLAGAVAAAAVTHAPNKSGDTCHIYIDADDTPDSVCHKLGNPWSWPLLMMTEYKVRTGRYAVGPGERILPVFKRLRGGVQEPLSLTVPSVRTTQQLAQILGHRLMLDGDELARLLTDSTWCARWGHTTETVPTLFLPNTYEVYWDMSIPALMRRMQREWHAFWTPRRLQAAAAQGLTPTEVGILASIVDEETAHNPEKPAIAGLYLNRLRRGMRLQADPTVKYAKGDWAARRIYKADLDTPSPYNTYLHKGLPPGPIRIPSIAALEAVLQAPRHTYLYMCANEDFSGTHRFATSYAEHLRNARNYARALNARKIK